MKTNRQIVFTGINTAELVEVDYPTPGDNDIIVKTEISSISAGTERANITGDPNISIYAEGSVVFPRYAGYSSSGTVVEVGRNITDVQVGDKVAMSWSHHVAYNAISAGNYVKIPEGVTMKEAALCHISTFPMAALRKTRLEIGESIMVMGLGVLGMLAVMFAKVAGGAPVIAADPVKERRERALRCGADLALDPFDPHFAEQVKALTGGGVNAAIEVTGCGAGLNECLDCMQKFGRVALLGCTRDKNFTVDYYRKVHAPGISLIGAHTMARPITESSPGAFTQKDDIKATLKLLQYGRVRLDAEVDELHSPAECTEVYDRLIHEPHFPVFVQFDWNQL